MLHWTVFRTLSNFYGGPFCEKINDLNQRWDKIFKNGPSEII